MKNYLRYVLPASLIVLGILGFTMADVLQNWSNGTTSVFNIDTNGSLNLTGSASGFNYSPSSFSSTTGSLTVVGSAASFTGGTLSAGTLTSGTLSVYEPCQGTGFKILSFSGSSINASGGTLGFSFPTPFALSPGTLCNTGSLAMAFATATSAGITGGTLTITGTPSCTLLMGGR